MTITLDQDIATAVAEGRIGQRKARRVQEFRNGGTGVHGYICKTCGAPTPVGIGYAVADVAASAASAALTATGQSEGCH